VAKLPLTVDEPREELLPALEEFDAIPQKRERVRCSPVNGQRRGEDTALNRFYSPERPPVSSEPPRPLPEQKDGEQHRSDPHEP